MHILKRLGISISGKFLLTDFGATYTRRHGIGIFGKFLLTDFGANYTRRLGIGIFGKFLLTDFEATRRSELTSTFNPKERSDWGPKLVYVKAKKPQNN